MNKINLNIESFPDLQSDVIENKRSTPPKDIALTGQAYHLLFMDEQHPGDSQPAAHDHHFHVNTPIR